MITASAPGKLVLSGEYVVLDGAPAIAMAVNRRATARIDTGDGEQVEGNRLAEAVCETLGLSAADRLMALDTQPFSDAETGRKYGLGSSAALVVALAAALLWENESEAELQGCAYAAHERFQDGRGSGVDIACALHGGLLRYRKQPQAADQLSWPEGLHYAVLWSGAAANTRDLLDRFRAAGEKPSAAALHSRSEHVADLWESGDAWSLLEGLADYAETLRAFDRQHRIGVFESGHDEIADAAARAGLVYKPCGAGGGDPGIVLGLDADKVARFAAESGFTPLQLRLDPQGVLVDGESQ